MANTKIQHEVEDWILTGYLPDKYQCSFEGRKVKLTWGGFFNFDAVSKDGKIVGNISTSSAKTAGGKQAIGKYHKLKADILYLLAARNAAKRLLIFTEKEMRDHFASEQNSGRLPSNIELVLVKLPTTLRKKLEIARKSASDEMRPNGER